MDFPSRLKELRLERKLTQEELGSKVNVTKVSISGYESGNRKPDIETLGKLADFFGVIVDFLLGKTNYRTTQELAEQTQNIPSIEQHTASKEHISEDPKISRFFKDFNSAPKEKQEETIRFLEFIQQKEKDRKPGDKQGD